MTLKVIRLLQASSGGIFLPFCSSRQDFKRHGVLAQSLCGSSADCKSGGTERGSNERRANRQGWPESIPHVTHAFHSFSAINRSKNVVVSAAGQLLQRQQHGCYGHGVVGNCTVHSHHVKSYSHRIKSTELTWTELHSTVYMTRLYVPIFFFFSLILETEKMQYKYSFTIFYLNRRKKSYNLSP